MVILTFIFETDNFAEEIEYFRHREKWFKNSEYKVNCMMNDKEDEL